MPIEQSSSQSGIPCIYGLYGTPKWRGRLIMSVQVWLCYRLDRHKIVRVEWSALVCRHYGFFLWWLHCHVVYFTDSKHCAICIYRIHPMVMSLHRHSLDLSMNVGGTSRVHEKQIILVSTLVIVVHINKYATIPGKERDGLEIDITSLSLSSISKTAIISNCPIHLFSGVTFSVHSVQVIVLQQIYVDLRLDRLECRPRGRQY